MTEVLRTDRLPRPERAALMRDTRRAAIMAAATALASKVGFANMTRDAIANEAGVACGSINHEFGTLDALRDAVMADAVEHERLGIIAQGLAAGHAVARDAPTDVKQAAINAMAA